jgi:hypothetical protein
MIDMTEMKNLTEKKKIEIKTTNAAEAGVEAEIINIAEKRAETMTKRIVMRGAETTTLEANLILHGEMKTPIEIIEIEDMTTKM